MIFILCLLIVGAAVLLIQQIKRAWSITTRPSTAPLISPVSVFIPGEATEPVLGNPGAPLTIMEFSDLGCSRCGEIHMVLADFVSNHPEDARLIFKHAPEQKLFLKSNTLAHQAAYCAGKIGRFSEFVTAIFAAKKSHLDEPLVKRTGEQLQLPMNTWWSCATGTEAEQHITAAIAFNQQLGISEYPTIFINNRWINLKEDIDLAQLLESFITP